ncbi:MAG: PilT/PilU family type 4a pilus ATPase [Candidatus Omnitrophota bacterium]|nr:PilT/PilU family type 4a pilus ATPase [Candidatus Omnitrophota bacterium]
MYKITELFKMINENGASDLHLCVGIPPMMRVHGELKELGEKVLTGDDLLTMIKEVLPGDKAGLIDEAGDTRDLKDIDLGIEVELAGRFRTNIYHDKNGLAAAFRLIPNKIGTLEDLGLPEIVKSVFGMPSGLVLVTGVTGSGKSTTLASIIDKINSETRQHIITVEDPIEYVHKHKKCIVNQRELGAHTGSFSDSLRSALREDPDVILVGEMRDLETISMTITAAETGHLVFSTLHTRGAPQTVDRMIDVFPPHQQSQIRLQLADVLVMTISQLLLPSADGKRMHLASEVMVGNSSIKALIRDQKTHQIASAIQMGGNIGMQTLDASLKALSAAGKISKDIAQQWMMDKPKTA